MRDSKRDTDLKNRLLDSVGEGKGGMIWENSIETCILSYVKQIASPDSMHETGCSGLVHWNDPEGSGWGTHVHPWLIRVNVWQNPLQYCKVISLQLKQINQLKKKKELCFWTVVLEKTLESTLDSKEIKPVKPKEINFEYSLEGMMLKLKLPYFGHLMWRADSLERPWCWQRLRAGGEGGNRGWDGWMILPTQWIWVWANSRTRFSD